MIDDGCVMREMQPPAIAADAKICGKPCSNPRTSSVSLKVENSPKLGVQGWLVVILDVRHFQLKPKISLQSLDSTCGDQRRAHSPINAP